MLVAVLALVLRLTIVQAAFLEVYLMVFAEKYAQITTITVSTMLLALDVLPNAVLASI